MNTVIIEDLDILIHKLNTFGGHWVFRGQSDCNWLLESTLERILKLQWNKDFIRKIEIFSLLEFQTKAHHYLSKDTTPNTKLGWLSLMQHHGVPTRLLDFSQSPYIALYFAFECSRRESQSDMAVWAIDYRAIMKNSIDFIKRKNSKFDKNYQDTFFQQDQIFEDLLDKQEYDILWITEPRYMNFRLERQMGTFLISVNPILKISDLLLNNVLYNKFCEKIVISHKLRESLFLFLQKININAKNIYGDIEGLSKDIKEQICYFS